MDKSDAVLVITSIELRSPLYFFALSLSGMKIVKQLSGLPCLGWKSRGFWKSHYTMTLWKSRAALAGFVREGAHGKAMSKGPKLATEVKILTIGSSSMVTWKEAIARIKVEGRVIKF